MFSDEAVPPQRHDPLELIEEAGLPVYGLGPGFVGTRAIARTSFQRKSCRSRGRLVESAEWWLGLAHLAPIDGSGISVEIATVTPNYSPQQPEQVLYEAALRRPTGQLEASNGHPIKTTIPVDGLQLEFNGWRTLRAWSAAARLEHYSLLIVAFNYIPEETEVRVVRDLGHYAAGREELLRFYKRNP